LAEIDGFALGPGTSRGLGASNQFSVSRLGAVLSYSAVNGGNQHISFARLGEELEDMSAVDGIHGGLHVGISGEQHSHGIGRPLANLGQEVGAVHAGHAHVGDDDRPGTAPFDHPEALFAADGGSDIELAVEDSQVALEGGGFVVDAENFFLHQSGLRKGVENRIAAWAASPHIGRLI
jgi:hypothetical protein